MLLLLVPGENVQGYTVKLAHQGLLVAGQDVQDEI
jgi:hypothetical protein